MKLIDFLVSSGRGGWKWPNGIGNASCNAGSRDVIFHFEYCPPSLTETLIAPRNFDSYEIVTREQYEAALAASKPEWNGDGVPPVGTECEMSNAGDEWHKCVIIAKGEEQIIYQTQGCREFSGHRNNYRFRPIRSEADKKRDEAVTVLHDEYFSHAPIDKVKDALYALYDAIAAGKIPHIRID